MFLLNYLSINVMLRNVVTIRICDILMYLTIIVLGDRLKVTTVTTTMMMMMTMMMTTTTLLVYIIYS